MLTKTRLLKTGNLCYYFERNKLLPVIFLTRIDYTDTAIVLAPHAVIKVDLFSLREEENVEWSTTSHYLNTL